MSVPFRTIAIIDPERLTDTTPETVQSWAMQAIERGADAFLLRNPGIYSSCQEAFTILKPLCDRHCVILLSQLYPGLDFTQVDGIHFKSGEVRPSAIPSGLLTGRSCHTAEEVRKAKREGMDYVVLSPVFPTTTHPDRPALGLYTFGIICQGNTIPIFGLGGITKVNQPLVLDSGAAGVASISMFL